MREQGANTILLVDDDETFRKRLGRAFKDRGFGVLEAGTLREAADHLAQNAPEKIVLDLKLGDESGMAFLAALPEPKNTKVVVLTGYGTIATAVDAMKKGAINYLTKPVDADTVLAAFDKNLPTQIETPPLAQVEWDHIQRVMSEHSGNISQASKALGMHRRSLQRKLAKRPGKLK